MLDQITLSQLIFYFAGKSYSLIIQSKFSIIFLFSTKLISEKKIYEESKAVVAVLVRLLFGFSKKVVYYKTNL